METVNFKQQEALFRQTVRAAHRLFCKCPDPANHLKEWRTSGEGTSTGGLTNGILGTATDGADRGEPTGAESG